MYTMKDDSPLSAVARMGPADEDIERLIVAHLLTQYKEKLGAPREPEAAMRVFVDIDDTLIEWHNKAAGSGVFWEPNEAIVDFVAALYRDGFQVTFWSAGGADYAHGKVKETYMRLDRAAPDHEILAKYPVVPQKGFIFIDDDPLDSYKHRTVHPSVITIMAAAKPKS